MKIKRKKKIQRDQKIQQENMQAQAQANAQQQQAAAQAEAQKQQSLDIKDTKASYRAIVEILAAMSGNGLKEKFLNNKKDY